MAPPAAPAARRLTMVATGLILLAVAAAYRNSFTGPFVHDDVPSIVDNSSIRHLWPIGQILLPPTDRSSVDRRPVANLSFALNYALSRTEVGSYHVLNLAAHMAAALVLFSVVRRTLLLPALRESFGAAATPLACIVAIIWAVHPLQTNAVTYIVQRTEVLAGLFYLLTLYCVIRGATSGSLPARPTVAALCPADRPLPTARYFWYAAAVAACLLAMGSKEAAVSAPLVVLLYDRLFLAGSWPEVLRRRWGLYAALAATWSLLVFMLLRDGLIAPLSADAAAVTPAGSSAGLPDGIAWLDYALVQFESVVWYLRLCFWPAPLVLDYGPGTVHGLGEVLPCVVLVVMLACGTLLALRRWPALGFLGVCFFAILAPSSGLVPITSECAAEKRMYLPLAAVVLAVVGCMYRGGQRWLSRQPDAAASRNLGRLLGYGLALLVVLALTLLSARRNEDYRSAVAIWQDNVDKRPQNFRALNNLGVALADAGKTAQAVLHLQQASQLSPDYAIGHANLGAALAKQGDASVAIQNFQEALRLKPNYPLAHVNLAAALVDLGRIDEAMEHFQEALRLKPDCAQAHNDFATALAMLGKTDEAIQHASQAVQLKPEFAEAHNNLGKRLNTVGRTDEAMEHFLEALRLKPDYVDAYNNLGIALAQKGRLGAAVECWQHALQLDPESAPALNNLAIALAGSGHTAEAIEHYRHVLRQTPNATGALIDLAWLLATREAAAGGDPAQAVQLAERARELGRPDDIRGLDTLAAAYAAAGRFPEAVAAAEKAAALAESAGQAEWGKRIDLRLKLYRAGQPYRETPQTPPRSKP